MFRKFLLTAAVAVAVALVAPATSKADFILTVSESGFTSLTIDFSSLTAGTHTISGLTVTWTPSAGTASVKGNYGNYNLNINTDQYTISGAPPATATLENDTSTVTRTHAEKTPTALTFVLSNVYTGVTPGVGVTAFNDLSSSKLTKTSVITGTTSVGGTNLGTLAPATVSGPIPSNSGSDVTSASGQTTATSIKITNTTVVTGLNTVGGNGDEFTLFSTVESTNPNIPFIGSPAPAGLILAATMVPFFGLLRRRLSRMAPETPVSA